MSLSFDRFREVIEAELEVRRSHQPPSAEDVEAIATMEELLAGFPPPGTDAGA